jgi:hypothetical protein
MASKLKIDGMGKIEYTISGIWGMKGSRLSALGMVVHLEVASIHSERPQESGYNGEQKYCVVVCWRGEWLEEGKVVADGGKLWLGDGYL